MARSRQQVAKLMQMALKIAIDKRRLCLPGIKIQ